MGGQRTGLPLVSSPGRHRVFPGNGADFSFELGDPLQDACLPRANRGLVN